MRHLSKISEEDFFVNTCEEEHEEEKLEEVPEEIQEEELDYGAIMTREMYRDIVPTEYYTQDTNQSEENLPTCVRFKRAFFRSMFAFFNKDTKVEIKAKILKSWQA